MTFSVYSTASHQPIIHIENNHVSYIDPNFAHLFEKINVDACFKFYLPGEKKNIFGDVKVISKNDLSYPKALRMYCEAQLLTHPETYYSNSKSS